MSVRFCFMVSSHCDDHSGIGGVERPGIVHRLDKDTTGLILVAKNDRSRQALHAWKIAFVHPGTEQEMELEAPPPEDLTQLIEALRVG